MIALEKVIKGESVPMTQQQVADLFGVTRAAVYLIERRAVEKIREEFKREAAAAGLTVAAWCFGDEQ
jgi:transcriptional regulator